MTDAAYDASDFTIDAQGWCASASRQPSPNRNARPAGMPVDLLVIHNISLPPGQFGGPEVEDLFANRLDCDAHPYFDALRGLEVSSHFFVRRDGRLIQFVSVLERAWHAGLSRFAGRSGCNDFSVGVELEGTDDMPYAPCQYQVLALLTAALQERCGIAYVTGHEHIAPGRKTDPGASFDWKHYEAAYRQTPYARRHPLSLHFSCTAQE